ncbi:MAG: aldehyde dehydrogenase family protein [Anaerolineae bacterium]|nr:aldehyde dehydrogenase family protein [Anaerolineae bacterium]
MGSGRQDSMKAYLNYIGGEWRPSRGGATFEDRNPADWDDVIGTFPLSTRQDAVEALSAARAAQPGWAAMSPVQRGEILLRAGLIMESRLDDLARTLTREEGKTLREATGEVRRAVEIFKFFAGEGRRLTGAVFPSDRPGSFDMTRREPLGVVTIITPWNFPVAIPAWKMAPALVAGNAVVFKPASLSPLIGLEIVRALEEAGLPDGVVNLVTGSGGVVGDELTGNEMVDAISFTGSYEVGYGIYQRAAPRMVRIQTEMGGKNPLVVLADADLDLAVQLAVIGGYGGTGQSCTATSRIIVEEPILEAFTQRLKERAESLRVGNGLDPDVEMGPAVSEEQLRIDLDYIEIGKREGARLIAGGDVIEGMNGYFIRPTLFADVRPDMRIAQEEIFGPVIGIIPVRDFGEAVAVANQVQYGLSASICTNDMRRAFQFAEQVEAGVVKINQPTTGLDLHVPFGGFKRSSSGTFKEQGRIALDFYTRLKTVYVGYAP